ncbi:MAG: MFS transporter [Dehalococcoidia bacterium]
MPNGGQSSYRWYVLALSAATHTFVAAMSFSCMPVLFKEISEDLGLSLVQIGTVWGMASLAGVFVALIGGLLGDRFGVKLVLGSACLLLGIAGALRGLSGGFVSLATTVFIYGLVRAIIPVNVHKTVSIWFQGKNLGLANGVVSMGMGIGLMLGPMISATLLSPLLGGWRNVLFLYGAVSVVVSILWFLFMKGARQGDSTVGYSSAVPIRQALSKLIRIKNLWLLGFTLMFRTGCIIGMVGYLPLYLREQGWSVASADGTLAGFWAVSTMTVIPLSLLSDRLGSRKTVLFAALLTAIIGVGLLPVVDGIMVWILIVLVGIFMDGFMAVILTMVQETEGVGPRYSGTALGLVFTISQLGAFISPPVGNSLASINSGLPFIFWAALSIAPLVTLAFTKETGWRRIKNLTSIEQCKGPG